MSADIPNLDTVDPGQNIWRGGQPNDAGWDFLKRQGITNVVKLNTRDEGMDVAAEALGMEVREFPIPLLEQLLTEPTKALIDGAVASIGPNTFIHCEHGQDRTGLVVGAWKVDSGIPKADAEADMLSHGFHKELLGLWFYWENHVPDSGANPPPSAA